MPRMNEQEDDVIIKKNQETTPGLFVSAGIIEHGDYDQKDWQSLIKDYTDMRNLDPVIKGSSDALTYPITASERMLQPGDDSEEAKEVARYVDWVYDNIDKGFDYLKYHKLLSIFFGVSLHEIIIKRNDAYVDSAGKKRPTNRIIKMSPIMPETVYKWIFDEQSFDLIGIQQEKRMVDGANVITDVIPIEKLDLLTFNEEFDDPRGNSILRPIRMSWDSKKKVLLSKVLNTQRGSGIPRIKTLANLTDNEKAQVKTIGRTLALGQNSYVAYDGTKMEVDLLQPTNQSDVMSLLEFLNREIFFNTLTEFLTAGIGQNGSRAATSEHKSAYELSASYILQVLEENFQSLTNKIVGISYYGNLPKEKWPIFKFGAIVQTDLTNTSTQLEKLINSGWLEKQPGDEERIRELFNMPTKEVNQQAGPNEDVEENQDIVDEGQMCGCGDTKKLNRELSDNEKHIFELASAQDFYLNIQEQTNKIINKYVNKMFDSIADQAERKGKDASLTIPYKGILVRELSNLYEDGFNRGERDMNKEINKVVKTNTSLALEPSKKNKQKKSIDRFVGRLIFNIATVSEDKLQKATIDRIKNAGGFKIFTQPLRDGFKGDKKAVAEQVESSYIDGRGEIAKDRKTEVALWEYSAILDEALCEECGPFDGNLFKFDELSTNGLQPLKPVNLNCLGGERCRCVLIPSDAAGQETTGPILG